MACGRVNRLIAVYAFLAAGLWGCGSSLSVTGNPPQPTSSSASQDRSPTPGAATPTESENPPKSDATFEPSIVTIDIGKPTGGFQDVSIELAFRNVSPEPAKVRIPARAQLSIAEGRVYDTPIVVDCPILECQQRQASWQF